jgi:hypothetical protein
MAIVGASTVPTAVEILMTSQDLNIIDITNGMETGGRHRAGDKKSPLWAGFLTHSKWLNENHGLRFLSS